MHPEPHAERAGVLELTQAAHLKALAHPLRLKVLQVLGDGEALTNSELATRLDVDPGHLHFHVRMLHRAGLIELAPTTTGRVKPYRLAATRMRVGVEVKAAGVASELYAEQLRQVQRGLDKHGETGEFSGTQVVARISPDVLHTLVAEFVGKLEAAETDDAPPETITLAFHPFVPEADPSDTGSLQPG